MMTMEMELFNLNKRVILKSRLKVHDSTQTKSGFSIVVSAAALELKNHITSGEEKNL